MNFHLLTFITFSITGVSCTTIEQSYDYQPVTEEYNYYAVNDAIEENEEINALVKPYARKVSAIVSRTITRSQGVFEKDNPEGTLGNLIADIVRYRATTEMRELVHVSVLSNELFSDYLPEGEITIGHIYEIIPFDSKLVVLKLSGKQLMNVAHALAKANGDPVSGLRFKISGNIASDILVSSSNIEPNSCYWVVTNRQLADLPGKYMALNDALQRYELDIQTRDAVIEYLNGKPSITPYLDQRIR